MGETRSSVALTLPTHFRLVIVQKSTRNDTEARRSPAFAVAGEEKVKDGLEGLI